MESSKRKLILEKLKKQIQLEPNEIIELQKNPLTRTEAFSIVEDNPQKIEEYSRFDYLQEKASKGELTPEQLKFLCDTAFGIDSEESKIIYNAMIETNKVKQDEKIMDKNKRKQEILRKQREFYQGNNEKEENNGNIHKLNLRELSDEELQQAFFHYSLKKDKNSIDEKGLETRIGRNSEGIDKLSSIYFSYGLEGALETWDVWLKWRANRLYSPYWQEENKEIIEKIENDTATEQEKKEYYYKAQLWNEEFTSGKYREDKEKMQFLFDFQIDEMQASNYYLLDLKEGEDFSFDEVDVKKEANLKRKDRPNDMGYKIFKEMYGAYSDFDSSKVDKWNMNTFLGKQMTITPDRIRQLTLPNGKNDVLSIIEYLYDKYKEITPKEEQVKFDVLDSYMEYAKEKIKNNELQQFDRNTRIDENMSISHFHDQKSNVYFEDRTSGVYATSEYTITPNQIGKKSISAHIGKKDIAKGIVDRKVEERTNPQELESYSHNVGQGGTNDGR